MSAEPGTMYDVVVIGAGPAGGLAAFLLSRQGNRVLLVDRRPFPRYKVCGACVNLHAIETLRRAGLHDLVDRLDGIPLSTVSLRAPQHTLSLPLVGGLAVGRDQLDDEVASEAVKAGAEFLTETTAAIVPDGNSGQSRTVRLSPSDAPTRDVSARVVLAADGLGHSSLHLLPEFASRVEPAARIGLGTTFQEVPECYAMGTIYLAVHASGYVGAVRTAHSVLNVAAAIDPAFVRQNHGPGAAAVRILELADAPSIPFLAKAEWHGTVPLTRSPNQVAGQRLFLLGDAAGYVEPFTGEGIGWAYTAAQAVAPFASNAVDSWRPELATAWTAECRRLMSARQKWCRFLSGFIRRPWALTSAMSVLSRFPALVRPLVRRINGVFPEALS